MHVIMGATGHIGSSVARRLLDAKQPVTVVLHSEQGAPGYAERGAQVVVADVHDTARLHAAFALGERLFLLNPPAPPAKDTDIEERATVKSILNALRGLRPSKIVAQSTYGARAGEAMGDLGSLYELEQGLRSQEPTATVIRGAYYMSNWDAQLASARKDGVIQSFFPVDFELPMVAASDLGEVAARELLEPETQGSIRHVEGPERYDALHVAEAFAKALQRPVRALEIPSAKRLAALHELGFSDAAAASFSGMLDATLNGTFPNLREVERSSTSLEQYVHRLVTRPPPQHD